MGFWSEKDKDATRLDWDAQGAGGANALWTGTGGTLPGWYKALTEPGANPLNELARPAGLNYDPAAPVAAETNGFMPSENAFFEGGGASEVNELMAAEAAPYAATGALGGITGGLGLVGGAFQAADGLERVMKSDATEQDYVHGGLDIGGGLVAGTAGALGVGASGLLGAGAVAACAPAAAIAAPIAAAVGLGVAGDHRAEEMDLWGHGADGKARGSIEAAWETSQNAGTAVDNALGGGFVGGAAGALTAGASTAVLETGAVAADIGLGFESLGASSGMFGTAKNDDGKTYNMGAFQAMDHMASSAGNGVDDFLGLDHDSLAGEVVGGGVRGLIDGAGAGLALAADIGGGVVGGLEAVGGWIGDLF